MGVKNQNLLLKVFLVSYIYVLSGLKGGHRVTGDRSLTSCKKCPCVCDWTNLKIKMPPATRTRKRVRRQPPREEVEGEALCTQ